MALSNRDRVGKALDVLREGLTPFVERELQSQLGPEWMVKANQGVTRELTTDKGGKIAWDTYALLSVMWDQ